MRSANTSHQFSQVPGPQIQRSSFNRSSGFKTTFDSGYLVPMFVDEVLPGDTFNLRSTFFGRLATPLTPVMDNLFLDTFFFFVPNRLLWDNWEKFNGAQDNPGDSTSFLVPQVTNPGGSGWTVGSLADFFGIPTGVTGFNVNALHFRAYNLIYNTWFRDQNLQNSVPKNTGNGPDTASDYAIKRRGKRHDYFTACLPWPQKGTAVNLPLGGTATVNSTNVAPKFSSAESSSPSFTDNKLFYTEATLSRLTLQNTQGSTGQPLMFGSVTGLSADLSTASGATINSFRQAMQLQAFYERDARGGTRYTEILRSHFGVVSPDARLQRPEYLGGGSQRLTMNPVVQTSGTGASGTTTPQGNLAGMSTVSAHGHGFTKSFVEHGVILGLMAVRADLNYQQGTNKMWLRQTRADFYWPAFAQLGEQAVQNMEIYTAGNGSSGDTLTFGYQERYAEYRYKPSQITGQFRSTYSTPLDMWHLAQKFTSLPVLNDTFISDTPPLSRVLAVGTGANGQQLLMDAFHDLKCARPMPVYSVPAALYRF